MPILSLDNLVELFLHKSLEHYTNSTHENHDVRNVHLRLHQRAPEPIDKYIA